MKRGEVGARDHQVLRDVLAVCCVSACQARRRARGCPWCMLWIFWEPIKLIGVIRLRFIIT
jgi:hypothetical protein